MRFGTLGASGGRGVSEEVPVADDARRYRLVSDFGPAEVGKGRAVVWRGFRVFKSLATDDSAPASRAKRVSNALTRPPFDYRQHTLFDYPTVIAGKWSTGDWQRFNSMASVHVPNCDLACWHGYNDAWPGTNGVQTEEHTARELVDLFLRESEIDAVNGTSTRVLRIDRKSVV